jgi:hypothetical protein
MIRMSGLPLNIKITSVVNDTYESDLFGDQKPKVTAYHCVECRCTYIFPDGEELANVCQHFLWKHCQN